MIGDKQEMNNMITFNRNELCINRKTIMFDYDIRETIVDNNQVIVLLSIPFNVNEIDNIYAVSLECNINWKVESLNTINPSGFYFPYENIFLKDQELTATDFYGRRCYINTIDGTIIRKDVCK